MGCDVCSKEIPQDTGYMLSTTQAITNPRYWEFFFRHYYPQQVEYLGRNGERLASYVLGRAADNTGWALCESCMQMYSINKSKAHQYFETWQQTGRLPSDFGTVDFAHALLREACAYDAGRLRALEVRFSAPVFPGETIRTEIWRAGDVVSFRASVPARGVLALNHGRAEIAAES